MRLSCIISDFPGKSGFLLSSSAKMHPTLHISTAHEYSCAEKHLMPSISRRASKTAEAYNSPWRRGAIRDTGTTMLPRWGCTVWGGSRTRGRGQNRLKLKRNHVTSLFVFVAVSLSLNAHWVKYIELQSGWSACDCILQHLHNLLKKSKLTTNYNNTRQIQTLRVNHTIFLRKYAKCSFLNAAPTIFGNIDQTIIADETAPIRIQEQWRLLLARESLTATCKEKDAFRGRGSQLCFLMAIQTWCFMGGNRKPVSDKPSGCP